MKNGSGFRGFHRLWRVLALMVVLALAVLAVHSGRPLFSPLSAESPTVSYPLLEGIAGGLETGIAKVQPLLDRYGYPALFLSIFVEGFGIFAPGQSLLIAASLDSVHGNLNIVWVLTLALAASVIGNLVGYLIGRWGGRAVLTKVRVNENHLVRVEKYFARKGAAILFIARFLDGLRQLNGIVAGILGMPWRRFMAFSTVGAIFWTAVWGLGVYLLDKRITLLHLRYQGIQPIVLALSVALVAGIAAYILWHRRDKGADGERR
jgi:membrane protein DedA with SNARE-associated domain